MDKKGNNINKEKKSNFIKEFFLAFAMIFKYAFDVIKFPFTMFSKNKNKKMDTIKPDLNTNNVVSNKEIKNDNIKIIDNKEESDVETLTIPEKKEEKKSFSEKLWAVLNSDIGGNKVKKISKSKAAKIEKSKQKLLNELNNSEIKRENKAVVYVYKAKTKSGKLVSGRLFGFSKMDINAFLLNEGYEPYYIENNKWIDFLYGESVFGSRRMKNKDLIFWLTQLATYVKAGITLSDSMKILINQVGKDKNKLGIYQSIVYELTMGNSFSEALEKQGNVFPPLLINMLKAAEATGELEETLDDMVNYYTDVETTRKEMMSAMTYPAIVTVFAFGVITFIMLYVVPQFSEIYESMEVRVSGLTLFLLKLSQFLQSYFISILLVIIVIIFVIVMLYKNVKPIRKFLQIIFMKTPVFGKIIIYKEMVIFSKTFSSLLKNNVNITESVEILGKITSNEIYKEIMQNTVKNIEVGDRISEAFKDKWAVPDVAYHMIVTGESTGQLSEMMTKVALFYQEQHHALVSSLKSLIEPILIATLAVIVGAILIAVIVPMFDMYEKISMG